MKKEINIQQTITLYEYFETELMTNPLRHIVFYESEKYRNPMNSLLLTEKVVPMRDKIFNEFSSKVISISPELTQYRGNVIGKRQIGIIHFDELSDSMSYEEYRIMVDVVAGIIRVVNELIMYAQKINYRERVMNTDLLPEMKEELLNPLTGTECERFFINYIKKVEPTMLEPKNNYINTEEYINIIKMLPTFYRRTITKTTTLPSMLQIKNEQALPYGIYFKESTEMLTIISPLITMRFNFLYYTGTIDRGLHLAYGELANSFFSLSKVAENVVNLPFLPKEDIQNKRRTQRFQVLYNEAVKQKAFGQIAYKVDRYRITLASKSCRIDFNFDKSIFFNFDRMRYYESSSSDDIRKVVNSFISESTAYITKKEAYYLLEIVDKAYDLRKTVEFNGKQI